MKHHEREFFIYMIRSGKVFVNHNDEELEIRPITIDQSFKSCSVYKEAYDKAYSEEIMTEEEMDQWMLESDLWTAVDDKQETNIKNDIEKFKLEIYNFRDDEKAVKRIRAYLRAAETKLSSHLNKKYLYHQNTCEGIASSERLIWIIKHTTYKNNEPYDFKNISLQYVVDEWQSHFLSDSKSRELARNEPWRSIWVTRENSGIPIFMNPPNTDLTHNQKNLLIWSQMYDNIQESLECPSKEVIDDDDMLDGWFILQGKKREKERLERELDNDVKNDKIKNASEVFMMSNDEKKTQKINMLNDPSSTLIKKQRNQAIQNRGSILEQDLPDQRRNIQMMANNQLKGK